MLISGYHRYKAEKWYDLLLPTVPFVCVSIVANIVNFSPINSDYMFFKGTSFIFPAIFGNLPMWLTFIIIYLSYLLIHIVFYLPSYIKNKVEKKKNSTNADAIVE